ncbi:DUF6291 domain-containing protein [Carboxylicivirga marina]|uniref:DUF6291 domain-containing protein n=1 Tax=Carboxylicivirga marina TaxID=2800988 RepID=A0ABS1HHD1_9BACT|nr:DUF6291 domain-containing protein [Carboxylicivirga marina]MBK3516688.1 hypothetical protein [Carboxylicivirga marina]
MAKDKKSFLLYTDLIHTVSQLPDDKAGALFKHILEYVNDKEPETNDIIVKIAFEPIKQGLKRDLEKYLKIIERNKANGKRGGRPKKETQENPNKPTGLNENPKNPVGNLETQENPSEPKKADSDNDSVSVSVNESVLPKGNSKVSKDTVAKAPIFFFKKELVKLGIDPKLADEWIKVRKLKRASNTQTAFEALKKQFNKSGKPPNECVKIAVENSWSGFNASWIKDEPKKDFNPKNVNDQWKD